VDANGNVQPPVTATDFVPPGEGRLNFVHMADEAGPVDIFLDERANPLISNLGESSASGARPLTEGTYTVNIVPAGEEIEDAVVTLEDFRLGESDSVTLVVYDDSMDEIQILELPEEDTSGVSAGQARFRVTHLSPQLQNVRILDAANPEEPVEIDESFNDVPFTGTTEYVDRNVQAITLGVDADERDDLEVTFEFEEFAEMSTTNLLIDSSGVGEEQTFRTVIVGSGQTASGIVMGTTIPDPTFLRAIHLASRYGTGPEQSIDLFFGFDRVFGEDMSSVQSPVGFLASSAYTELEAGNEQLTYVFSGGTVNDGFRNPFDLGVLAYQTAVIHGAFCDNAADCELTLLTDEDPGTQVPTGQVRVRFMHAAANLGPIDISSPAGVNLELTQEGDVSAYQNLPVDDYDFRIRSGGQAFDFSVDADEWTPQGLYTLYFVNDVANATEVLVLQDAAGNTTTIRQRGQIRAVSLLSNAVAQDFPITVRLDGNPIYNELGYGTLSPVTDVEQDTYQVFFSDGQNPPVSRSVRVNARETTIVVASGYTDLGPDNVTSFELPENNSTQPASDEIAWRFFHGAADFGNPNFQFGVNVDVLSDNPITEFDGVAFGAFAGSSLGDFELSDNGGLALGVDVDDPPGGPNEEPEPEYIFEIPELNGGVSYSFILTRLPPDEPQPGGSRGPIVLVAIGEDGDTRIIGPATSASLYHLSSTTGPIDLHVDGDPTPSIAGASNGATANPPFSEDPYTDDISIEGGNRQLDIALEGEGVMNSILTATPQVFGGEEERLTLAVYGEGANRGFGVYRNRALPPMQAPDPQMQYAVRVIHTAGEFGPVNLYQVPLDGMSPSSLNNNPIPPGDTSDYFLLPVDQPIVVGVDRTDTNSSQQTSTDDDSDYFFRFEASDLGVQPGTQHNLLLAHDPATGEIIGYLENALDSAGSGPDVKTIDPEARVRLFHGSGPDAPVSLEVEGSSTFATGLGVGTVSRWVPFTVPQDGTADFDVRSSGMGTSLISELDVAVEDGGSYTLGFATLLGSRRLVVVTDDFVGIDDPRVRAIHLVDDSALDPVDVLDVSTGNPPFPLVFDDVALGSASATSADVPPNTDLELGLDASGTGTPQESFTIPGSLLPPGMHANAVAFTDNNSNLQIFVVLADGFTQSVFP